MASQIGAAALAEPGAEAAEAAREKLRASMQVMGAERAADGAAARAAEGSEVEW